MRCQHVGRRVALASPILLGLVLVLLLACRILVNVALIFSAHSGIALTQDEVDAAHNARSPDPRQPQIPKIIHQIFHNWADPSNNTVPVDWDARHQSCIALHEDWEHKLWTEAESRRFLADEYPWFLATYDGYGFPIQRVDSLRYFLMLHFGGIYLDLDNGCLTSLEPLLYYPVFLTDGGHGALSNNILGARPGHPFWKQATESLLSYDWNYILPYITIMYGSGQWFLTAMWELYHRGLSGNAQAAVAAAALAPPGRDAGGRADVDGALYRIMMDQRPGADRWIFFNAGRGGTWRNWDNRIFNWAGEHLVLVFGGAAALVAVISWLGMRVSRNWRRKSARGSNGYTLVRG